ncbi:hypothetical protein OH76DRAFT_1119303 [Lentinus brumalis]|uniref:Uncharacterized protein n=1 Tax=Lentinus brumalis TaxID=2498619 RepID=A0A371CUQ4_9APHY|nr:hypothetical protein OH76DRAFT_1119303 [Polyporus brumalis]
MATAADDRPEYTPASLTKSYVFRAFPFIFPLPLLFYPPGARYYDGETRTHSAKWSCSLPSKISTPAAKLGRRRTTFKDSRFSSCRSWLQIPSVDPLTNGE